MNRARISNYLALGVAVVASLIPLLVFIIVEPFFYELPVDAIVRVSSSETLVMDARFPSSTHIIINSNKTQFNITLHVDVLNDAYRVNYDDIRVNVETIPIYYVVFNESRDVSMFNPLCGFVNYEIVDNTVVFNVSVSGQCEFAFSSEVRIVLSLREPVFFIASRKSKYTYYEVIAFRLVAHEVDGGANLVEYKPELAKTITPGRLHNVVMLILASTITVVVNLFIANKRAVSISVADVAFMLMVGLAVSLLLVMKIAFANTP